MRRLVITGFLAATALTTGCSSNYAITDPASGTTYYTTKYKKDRDARITFTDKRDKAEVTLQQYEVRKISGDEYKAGMKTDRRAAAAVDDAAKE